MIMSSSGLYLVKPKWEKKIQHSPTSSQWEYTYKEIAQVSFSALFCPAVPINNHLDWKPTLITAHYRTCGRRQQHTDMKI